MIYFVNVFREMWKAPPPFLLNRKTQSLPQIPSFRDAHLPALAPRVSGDHVSCSFLCNFPASRLFFQPVISSSSPTLPSHQPQLSLPSSSRKHVARTDTHLCGVSSHAYPQSPSLPSLPVVAFQPHAHSGPQHPTRLHTDTPTFLPNPLSHSGPPPLTGQKLYALCHLSLFQATHPILSFLPLMGPLSYPLLAFPTSLIVLGPCCCRSRPNAR